MHNVQTAFNTYLLEEKNMFVFNVKINKGRLFKIICIIIIILVVLTLFLSMSKIAKKIKSNSINANSILEIKSNDYTNFLKDCHDNIDKYVGKRVKISGYIYRMPDFSDNEIVIARTMLDMQNSTAVVVGLLANYDDAKKLNDNIWVECEGIIEKGNYHGDIPVLHIDKCSKISVPEDEFVSSPSD